MRAWNSLWRSGWTESWKSWKVGRNDRCSVQLSNLPTVGKDRGATGLAEFDFRAGRALFRLRCSCRRRARHRQITLLMQCAARLESQGIATLYVSGEESPDQLRLRADRLQEDTGGIHVLGETRLESILLHAAQLKASVVLLDSVQTTYTEELGSAPATSDRSASAPPG